MWALLALVCIVLGLIDAVFKVHLLMDPLSWFVAAIAFDLLTFDPIGFVRRGSRPAPSG